VARLPSPIKARLKIVQQCREEDLARVEYAYRSDGIGAELGVFFKNLPERMAGSHLVIARAGASTLAELGVLGRPAILVPLPHALDNDQLHNARRLESVGGAWCLEQRGLHPERLARLLADLFNDPARLTAASEMARQQGRPDAVSRLADLVERVRLRDR
jgi:UDP-N-acetylglucosamine--N-acetylmuramyl-(pentapeptide) pyrophosphoryl-undecaprenol N-acetylglucosamine transferase